MASDDPIDRVFDHDAGDEAGERVWRDATTLRGNQGDYRRTLANDCLTLYNGHDRDGIDGYAASAWGLDPAFGAEPPSYNVIQACVDTKVAHIVRNKVRPFFLTEKGDSTLREKAKGMQRVVEAVCTDEKLYGELGVDVCFDGNIFQGGCVKVVTDYGGMRTQLARVFPWQVFVSERESRKRDPRQMWYVDVFDRATLEADYADFPEAVEKIRNAPPAPAELSDAELAGENEVADQVMVVEYWHRPSSRVDLGDSKAFGLDANGEFDPTIDPGHDGRRIVCVDGGEVLVSEPWPYDYFPIKVFRPMPKRIGFWSSSLPEVLAGGQLAITRMNARIDAIMHLHARPLLYLWRQAKVNAGKIGNDIASIIEGNQPAGQAMQYIVPQAVPSEYIARVHEIIAWCEKQAGLSEMSISAAKPAGVDHAPGMQHLADTESVRHTPAFRAWEQFHIELAEAIVDSCRLLYEHSKRAKKDFSVLWGDGKDLQRIDWGSVDLGRDRYHLKVFPTNLLPTTPGAKVSRIIELFRGGLISQPMAQALLVDDYPDIEAVSDDATAQQENIERHLDALVKGEPYEEHMPQPYLNLELAKTMSANRINRLEADGESDEKIDPIRQFHEDVIELSKIMSAPGPGAGEPPPGGPPAAPPAPPEQIAA